MKATIGTDEGMYAMLHRWAGNAAGEEEYTLEELVPIPAKCPRCKRSFLGRDAISAPSLDNAFCFYCGPSRAVGLILHPKHKGFIDAKTRRHMTEAPLFATLADHSDDQKTA